MPRLALSSVATPDWTLPRLADAAAAWGYQGVELRTFGFGSRDFACDPALTDAAKLRDLLDERGLQPACVATGVGFDEPIRPPLLGRVKNTEASVRRAKTGIEIAQALAAPYVRVFGFDIGREDRRRATARIVERLALAADAARHTGVKLVLENGGSFNTATDLLELIDRVNSPLLGAEYSIAVAARAGEDPVGGAETLGERLWIAKLKDVDDEGRPCIPGDGTVPVGEFVRSLAPRRSPAWFVYEYDAAWLPELKLAPAEQVLPEAARRLFQWTAGAVPRPRHEPAVA
jgi:sugar phosphate isomerase/epimerase